MDGWNNIRWTEARQVVDLMGGDPPLPDPAAAPADHYRTLRDGGRDEDAVSFLGHALPRYEVVAWAGRVVEDEAEAAALRPADRRALDYALRWIGTPDDAYRRAAHAAGAAAGERAPERMLALAVFYSGGSISAPDLPPVQPAPGLAGRFASGAIRLAAHRSPDATATIARALALGERIAAHGVEALTTR